MNSLPPTTPQHPDQEPFALSEDDRLCLSCGLREISQWKHQGPEAPALSPALLRQVSSKKSIAWSRYAYLMAAALALLFMFVQVTKQDLVPDQQKRQSNHIHVDSALHDTVMLMEEDPNEDSIQTVSMKSESTHEQAEPSSANLLEPEFVLVASGLPTRELADKQILLRMANRRSARTGISPGRVAWQPGTAEESAESRLV